MISVLHAFKSQLFMLLFFVAIWYLRSQMENRDVFPSDFRNKYFATFMVCLWLIGGTLFRYYYQLPVLGIWAHILG